MPAVINDQTYYRTAEVCRMVGISRNTLFRWLKEGMISDIEYRDWRGWRLFTAAQLESIRAKANYVTAMSRSSLGDEVNESNCRTNK
jgi:predicted site-specific integrase-resolvase